ncbi:hypothetical protein GQR99_20730 (plasmid) [Cereibacter sphaeroides]|nr:hypothetical protein GQR99_20730 [Cereibacter sphaeroides]
MKMAEMFSSLKIYGTFRPEDGVYVILIPGTIGIAVIGIISSFIFCAKRAAISVTSAIPRRRCHLPVYVPQESEPEVKSWQPVL